MFIQNIGIVCESERASVCVCEKDMVVFSFSSHL